MPPCIGEVPKAQFQPIGTHPIGKDGLSHIFPVASGKDGGVLKVAMSADVSVNGFPYLPCHVF
jgi:hypothetical protein